MTILLFFSKNCVFHTLIFTPLKFLLGTYSHKSGDVLPKDWGRTSERVGTYFRRSGDVLPKEWGRTFEGVGTNFSCSLIALQSGWSGEVRAMHRRVLAWMERGGWHLGRVGQHRGWDLC